jgi:hypothetical protein
MNVVDVLKERLLAWLFEVNRCLSQGIKHPAVLLALITYDLPLVRYAPSCHRSTWALYRPSRTCLYGKPSSSGADSGVIALLPKMRQTSCYIRCDGVCDGVCDGDDGDNVMVCEYAR